MIKLTYAEIVGVLESMKANGLIKRSFYVDLGHGVYARHYETDDASYDCLEAAGAYTVYRNGRLL